VCIGRGERKITAVKKKKQTCLKKEEKTFLSPNRTVSKIIICALSWTLRLSDPGKSLHISKTIYNITDYPGTVYNFFGTF